MYESEIEEFTIKFMSTLPIDEDKAADMASDLNHEIRLVAERLALKHGIAYRVESLF